MARVSGWLVAVVTAAAVAGTACSSSTSGERGSGSTTTTTTTTAPATTTTTVASGSSTTRSVVPTTSPGAVSTTAAPATTPTTAGGPAVVTAGGWRMALTQPAAGATIGSVAVLCYEVTGSVREATVAFDVTFLQPGATSGTGPFRAEAAVGRGSARVPVTGVPSGRYDVRVQLVLDGERLDGAAVTIAGVNVVAGGSQAASC